MINFLVAPLNSQGIAKREQWETSWQQQQQQQQQKNLSICLLSLPKSGKKKRKKRTKVRRKSSIQDWENLWITTTRVRQCLPGRVWEAQGTQLSNAPAPAPPTKAMRASQYVQTARPRARNGNSAVERTCRFQQPWLWHLPNSNIFFIISFFSSILWCSRDCAPP